MDAWIETTPEQEDLARRIRDAIDRDCRLRQECLRAWATGEGETARMLDALDVFLNRHRRRTEASGWKFEWYYGAWRRLGLLGDMDAPPWHPNAPRRGDGARGKKKSRVVDRIWDED